MGDVAPYRPSRTGWSNVVAPITTKANDDIVFMGTLLCESTYCCRFSVSLPARYSNKPRWRKSMVPLRCSMDDRAGNAHAVERGGRDAASVARAFAARVQARERFRLERVRIARYPNR